MNHRFLLLSALAPVLPLALLAQVSSYTFSAEVGTWQPLGGSGTLLGMPGMPPAFDFYDDNAFVQQGTTLLLSTTTTGNGWPIGFEFNYNGQPYDRVGLSIEGWLAFGRSADGNNAVYVPAGSAAYTPLISNNPEGMDPLKRNRIAAFAMDLRAQGQGGLWPLQLMTGGTAPNRFFVAEWNVVRPSGSQPLSFQIRLNEGGGDPAQQTVQVIYGSMTQTAAMLGQVGLGGTTPSDYNNRSVTSGPYNWLESTAGTSNTAQCRPPSSTTYLPPGLTFTWTPAGCNVTGILVSDFIIQANSVDATLSWSTLPGASSYDFIITAGGPGDPVLFSGTGITGLSAPLTGLPLGQTLHAYVKADCAGPDQWGAGHPFNTENMHLVECGSTASFNHCYNNLEQTLWHYTSSNDSPVRMFIHAGTIHNGDLLQVFDGPTELDPVIFSSSTSTIAGQIITSTGPHLTMRLSADENGSCATQDFILPMEWEVGCMDCDPILANFNVIDDCANQQFSVLVDIFSLGSAASSIITNNGGAAPVTANGPGTYLVGPFPIGTPVLVKATNDYNDYCSAASLPLLNNVCPLVTCGPVTETYCYANNDESQWGFRAEDGGRIGIRFLQGTLAAGDIIIVYDGLDPFMDVPLFSGNHGGDLTNLLVTTTTSNMDAALLLAIASNGSNSCASGHALPMEYVVACYDGCQPPVVNYSAMPDCDLGTFTVQVLVLDMGTATALNITNDGGAPSVVASAASTYSVGPFALGDTLSVGLEGDHVLCGVISPRLHAECDVGIAKNNWQGIRVFPNPGNGAFRLQTPEWFQGEGLLDVIDVTGRTVAGMMVHAGRGQVVDCDLQHLPAGRYTMILKGQEKRAYAPISIVR